MGPAEVAKWTVPLALIAHQLFRRIETFYIPTHVFLVLTPPTLITALLFDRSSPLSTLSQIFMTSTATFLAALVLSIVLYRLSPFHPLARFPGPTWRKVTMLIPACQSISGNRHKQIDELHRKYGDVVRTGPNELCINNAELVMPLLSTADIGKGPYQSGGMLEYGRVPMVGLQDTEEHLHRRRAWTRGLGQSAIREYEARIALRADQLVERLEQLEGHSTNIGKFVKYFAFDFMSDMAFGGGSELLRDGDKNNIWSIIEQGMVMTAFLTCVPWFGIYLGYVPGASRPLAQLHANGRKLARERLQRGSETRDLFHYLSNEDLPNKPPPPTSQLTDDGTLAVVAGSDTVSVALTSIFYCLLTHPSAYEVLLKELDKVYPAGEDVLDTKHQRDLHYLQAVINEALRLFPPVPLGGQRQVPRSGEPVVVGSLVIPPGTSFYMSPWSLHHDARNFVHPKAFWPERWLIASGTLSLASARLPAPGVKLDEVNFVHNEVAFTPFAVGPLNCPGKALAMLEMRTVLVALLRRFRFRLCEGWDPRVYEEEFKDYFTAARPALPVTIEFR